jgi:hypothetical protein
MGSTSRHGREHGQLIAVGYQSLEADMHLIQSNQWPLWNPGGAGKQIAELSQDVSDARRRRHSKLHRFATGQIGVCREQEDVDVHGWKDNG